jgi:phosphate-selective porin
MRKQMLKRFIAGAASASCLLIGAPTMAADWLSLQGTEPAGAAARAKIWGFIQPQYTDMDGTKLKAGPWAGQNAIFNVVRPDNDTESSFHLRRARLGVRGTGFPLDSNVNYFLLAEFGNNGITTSGGGSVKVTDASVTLNHLKDYTRLRLGQFKTPGSEDGLQAIHVHNYNNFSLAADQLLLERFRDTDGEANCIVPGSAANPAPTLTDQAWFLACSGGNGLNGSVGAYRDIGLQLFNTFKIADGPGAYPWEVSYAFMVGNGNGIARGDNDDNRETYYYLSAGQVFGGKGARRQDWKVYAWLQDGKRTILDTTNSAPGPFSVPDPTTFAVKEFDRERWGVGGTYRKGKYRLYGEYIVADGMILNASDGGAVGGAVSNNGQAVSTFNTLTDNEAKGWYLDAGYKVLPNLELDVRYDELERGTEGAANIQRDFERWTIGAQYFFNKKSRFTLNYEFRDTEAPGGNANQKSIVSGTDDVLTAQVLIIF